MGGQASSSELQNANVGASVYQKGKEAQDICGS
jgi:hypothetical protein